MAFFWSRKKKDEGVSNSMGSRVGTIPQKSQPNRYPLSSGDLPRQYREFQNKDLNEIGNWSHENILKVIRATSPEASHAISLYLRLFDSGYVIEVTNLNGVPHKQGQELVENYKNGFILNIKDENEMSHNLNRKISLFFETPGIKQQMGKESLKVIEEYSVENMAVAYSRVLI